MDLLLEQHYPHPVEKVWRALATSAGLEAWLMRNDFEPVVGRACTFHFCPEDGAEESLVHVTVEALDPPRFMQWRWRNEEEAEATTVTFELTPTRDGTLLRLRHEGDASTDLADRLRRGWPGKLAGLGERLG
jgi:uncharacterized protein YndB with AHSA1/START domain